jgi:hypothetical protein
MNQKIFRISDHVMLRYMERALGVDIEAFRKKLQAQLEPAGRLGAKSFETGGMIFKFGHSPHEISVSTMWPADSPVPKLHPPRASKLSREAMNIAARKRMQR